MYTYFLIIPIVYITTIYLRVKNTHYYSEHTYFEVDRQRRYA